MGWQAHLDWRDGAEVHCGQCPNGHEGTRRDYGPRCCRRGIQIEDPATCGSQLDSVIGRPGPVLIEAVVDQFTPPMPAKIKAGRAFKLAEALVRGEPNRMKIALTNAHDRVRELV